MYKIIWQFRPRAGREKEFETAYGPDGEWAELFRRGDGFVGIELLHPEDERSPYVTIDTWRSKADFEAFKVRWRSAYEALDEKMAGLTSAEDRLGAFVVVR